MRCESVSRQCMHATFKFLPLPSSFARCARASYPPPVSHYQLPAQHAAPAQARRCGVWRHFGGFQGCKGAAMLLPLNPRRCPSLCACYRVPTRPFSQQRRTRRSFPPPPPAAPTEPAAKGPHRPRKRHLRLAPSAQRARLSAAPPARPGLSLAAPLPGAAAARKQRPSALPASLSLSRLSLSLAPHCDACGGAQRRGGGGDSARGAALGRPEPRSLRRQGRGGAASPAQTRLVVFARPAVSQPPGRWERRPAACAISRQGQSAATQVPLCLCALAELVRCSWLIWVADPSSALLGVETVAGPVAACLRS